VRSQEEKWKVPDEDPAGLAPHGSSERLEGRREGQDGSDEAERAQLIYCGLCGALNPGTSFYCAACGTTLVDAFHASEGLRVYDRPDTASRLIEIIGAGAELDVVEDPDAPADFVRVQLSHGRLGYIRLDDVAALANAPRPASAIEATLGTPDINTNARGCVTQTGALGALALLVVLSTLVFVWISRAESSDSGIMALAACITLGPLLFMTIGLFIYARSRDERLEFMAEEAAARRADDPDGT
jgi:hypothetical protein